MIKQAKKEQITNHSNIFIQNKKEMNNSENISLEI